MKQSSWKFFVIIGILLVMAGVYVYPLDDMIAIIGLLFGFYNIYKGVQLARGKQPYLIRKQQESLEKQNQELENQLKKAKKENKK